MSNGKMVFRRITDSIDKYINENSKGNVRPSEILLSENEFNQFVTEIEPTYKALYGSLISSSESVYENVLYRGIPICVKR